MLCETCGLDIRQKRLAQRYCSDNCRVTAYQRRTAKKEGRSVKQRKRLYGDRENRKESFEKDNRTNGIFSPPTYYFLLCGDDGESLAHKPLSDVEIAALGGFVAKKRMRRGL